MSWLEQITDVPKHDMPYAMVRISLAKPTSTACMPEREVEINLARDITWRRGQPVPLLLSYAIIRDVFTLWPQLSDMGRLMINKAAETLSLLHQTAGASQKVDMYTRG